MLNKEKYARIFLSVIALCAVSMSATHVAAQTVGSTAYVTSPNDGYFTNPALSTLPGICPMSGYSARVPAAMPPSTASPTPTPAPMQGHATIYGTVADSNGTAVAGAIVRLQGPSGAQYSTTSGKDGYFEISNVPYDSYTLSYTYGSYSSPATTLTVNEASIKHDITLPAHAERISSAGQAPAAIDQSAIKNWYAAYYTPPTLSNRSVIYDPSGHIVKVVTGNPCQAVEVPVSGH